MSFTSLKRLLLATPHPIIGLVTLTGTHVLAQPVTVAPRGREFFAGSNPDLPPPGKKPDEYKAGFQFHPHLENAAEQPSEWDMDIVALDGKHAFPVDYLHRSDWLGAGAVRPWGGGEPGAWECFLWDNYRQRLCRMDAKGATSVVPGYPGGGGHLDLVRLLGRGGGRVYKEFPDNQTALAGMAVDSKGTVYLAVRNSRPGGRYERHLPWCCVRRWDPDLGWTTLAGTTEPERDSTEEQHSPQPRDGQGAEARFGYLAGLGLDEEAGILVTWDLADRVLNTKSRIRVIELTTGKVSTVQPDRDALGLPDALSLATDTKAWDGPLPMACRGGKVLTMPSNTSQDNTIPPGPRLVVVDLKTGATRVPYRNPFPVNGPLRKGALLEGVPPVGVRELTGGSR